MSKLIKIDTEYASWITKIANQYKLSQIKAKVKVNDEMLKFYYSLGKEIDAIDAEAKWGSKVYDNLSMDLKNIFPETKGFSKNWAKIYGIFLQALSRYWSTA